MKIAEKNLRIGVVGVGTMGQHHVRIISQTPDVELAGFHDPDPVRAAEICSRHGCECFGTLDELLNQSDAVIVAAPTSTHYEIGEKCLGRGIHVLMEKPLAHEVEAAAKLVDLSRRAGVVLMVGHVERYNPAVGKLMELLRQEHEEIISIDARRLAPFDGSRCIDVDVLYDLLIHDIDLSLEIAGSSVLNVSAVGRPVFSKKTDVAHTRIEFGNGVAGIFWTGKCSPLKVRSLTVSTPRRCLVADTLACTLTVYAAEQLSPMENGLCMMGTVEKQEILVPHEEPLRREIADFLLAIREGNLPLVDGWRGLRAMQALALVEKSIAARGAVIQIASDDKRYSELR
ncbi:MAG: Gfo/Idh/MocA family oxidoreductase [Desulfomonilaceae bacterium]